jgi:hypothetical protein
MAIVVQSKKNLGLNNFDVALQMDVPTTEAKTIQIPAGVDCFHLLVLTTLIPPLRQQAQSL